MDSLQNEFFYLVRKGDVKKVRKLVDLRQLGKNPFDYKTSLETGETALHIAVNSENVEMVELLLNLRLDVNAKDKKGRTPLIIAAEKGNFKICRKLLERGANIALEDNKGYNALVKARFNLMFEIDMYNKGKSYATEENIKDKLFNYYFIIRLLKNEMAKNNIEIKNYYEINL